MPGVMAALKTLVAGPTQGNPTTLGVLMSLHFGEQFKVSGRGPVAWVMPASFTSPDYEGSDLEPTDWVIEVRLLHQFAPDQRHAEEVLFALVEPIRDVFRKHRKLSWTASTSPTGQPINSPNTTIARATVGTGQWLYIEVNRVMYRMLTLNVLVKEKVPVIVQAGS